MQWHRWSDVFCSILFPLFAKSGPIDTKNWSILAKEKILILKIHSYSQAINIFNLTRNKDIFNRVLHKMMIYKHLCKGETFVFSCIVDNLIQSWPICGVSSWIPCTKFWKYDGMLFMHREDLLILFV